MKCVERKGLEREVDTAGKDGPRECGPKSSSS